MSGWDYGEKITLVNYFSLALERDGRPKSQFKDVRAQKFPPTDFIKTLAADWKS